MHRFARHDAGSLDVHTGTLLGLDRALAVDRISKRVNDAAQQFRTNRNVHDGAGPLDDVAFLDVPVGTENHDADIVGFKVERHAANSAWEFDHFTSLDIVEAVNAGDTVTDGQNLTNFGNFGFLAEILDLVLENCGNFRGADIHQPTSFSACLRVESLVRSDVST